MQQSIYATINLHAVYRQYMQYRCSTFIDGWSNHRVRTVGNETPLQLWPWIGGMINLTTVNQAGYRLTNELDDTFVRHYHIMHDFELI